MAYVFSGTARFRAAAAVLLFCALCFGWGGGSPAQTMLPAAPTTSSTPFLPYLDYLLDETGTMDVEEAYVQTQEGYENFQMDHVLCETELTATYEFQPVFLGFVSILENFSNGFRIQNHSGYSYFHGKEGM